jgi:hypothetical protein
LTDVHLFVLSQPSLAQLQYYIWELYIFANSATNTPGAQIQHEAVSAVVKTTGVMRSNLPVFEVTLSIASVPLVSGTTYWIGLHTNTAAGVYNRTGVYWATAALAAPVNGFQSEDGLQTNWVSSLSVHVVSLYNTN